MLTAHGETRDAMTVVWEWACGRGVFVSGVGGGGRGVETVTVSRGEARPVTDTPRHVCGRTRIPHVLQLIRPTGAPLMPEQGRVIARSMCRHRRAEGGWS